MGDGKGPGVLKVPLPDRHAFAFLGEGFTHRAGGEWLATTGLGSILKSDGSFVP